MYSLADNLAISESISTAKLFCRIVVLRTERLNKVYCYLAKQNKLPETRPYGSILLECPCVWGEVGADGTGRVLGFLVKGFGDDGR